MREVYRKKPLLPSEIGQIYGETHTIYCLFSRIYILVNSLKSYNKSFPYLEFAIIYHHSPIHFIILVHPLFLIPGIINYNTILFSFFSLRKKTSEYGEEREIILGESNTLLVDSPIQSTYKFIYVHFLLYIKFKAIEVF